VAAFYSFNHLDRNTRKLRQLFLAYFQGISSGLDVGG
jgi:hypothetical protein